MLNPTSLQVQAIMISTSFPLESVYHPPRSASTKCSVAPPSSEYSAAVLSSALDRHVHQHDLPSELTTRHESACLHLLSAKDQSLLYRWNTLLLLNLFFDLRDLFHAACVSAFEACNHLQSPANFSMCASLSHIVPACHLVLLARAASREIYIEGIASIDGGVVVDEAYLVVGLDIKLDLLSGERSDPFCTTRQHRCRSPYLYTMITLEKSRT